MEAQDPTPAIELIVCEAPKEHDFTNYAYYCKSDLSRFPVRVLTGKNLLASLADGSILSLQPHDAIPTGHIALNGIQQQDAGVSVGDTLRAILFIPPADFDLAKLALDLEFLDGGIKTVKLNAVVLANHLREKFHNQVLTVEKNFAFECDGNRYVFKVTQAISKSDPGRGMVSANTAIVSRASSGRIKIVNWGEASTSNFYLSRLASNHLKAMLLYCPPSTSKIRAACQRMKMQNGEDPKIHGVEPQNNVLLTGITDLLDKMLLRPGELDYLDEKIKLLIHTHMMKMNSYLSPDVNLQELAARMKNYTEAQIGAVVRSAVSFALYRQLRADDPTNASTRVTIEDFHKALHEIIPVLGEF